MNALVALAAFVVTAVAAACVLAPFRRGVAGSLEGPPDPLEDQRDELIRGLRDLEEDHSRGLLDSQEYRHRRTETERRAVAVLRAVEARDHLIGAAPALRDLAPPEANGAGTAVRSLGARSRRVNLLLLVAGAAVVALGVIILARSLAPREAGQPITGTLPGSTEPISFYQHRVASHPGDVAARLDLAQRYVETGRLQSAIAQYREVVRLDPRNSDGHAGLAYALFRSGRARRALAEVDRALAVDRRYPEALYDRGLILRGLNRPAEAAASFRAYLRAAPYGSHRDEIARLLQRIGH